MKKTLFLLFLPLVLLAQNYLWPTNASTFLSSSFCEYRPGHYHSAIDIKTWNTEGYRIYAVEDGYVQRIRVSPFGYGKVLYLKLKDGRTAVYAHLQRFNKKLERAVRKQQLQKKRYTITWYPKNRKVRRGDILGYTGQTGIGVPHLHFEIRDTKGQPLNPLHFYNQITDHIPPKLQSILIRPMDKNSRVNGSFLPVEAQLKKGAHNTYRIKQPLRVKGRIGLAIRGYDMSYKVYNKYAFYRTSLRVNGKELFTIQYDTLNFDLSRQVDLEIDYPVYRQTKKKFHKLYIEPFNQLTFYKRNLGNGLFKVERDTVSFSIEVFDFFGNKSVIEGTLLPDFNALLRTRSVSRDDSSVLLTVTLPKRIQGLRFFSKADSLPWTDIKYFEIQDQSFTDHSQTLRFKIRLEQYNASRLKVKAFLPGKIQAETILPVSMTDTNRVSLKIRNRGKFLLIKTEPQQAFALLTVKNLRDSKQTPMRFVLNPEMVIPARALPSDSLRFLLSIGGGIAADSIVSVYSLNAGMKQHFSFDGGRCLLASEQTTVYDTLLFNYQKETIKADSFKTPVFGPAYRFSGSAQVLRKAPQLTIQYDSLRFSARQTGICRIGKKGRISWKSAKWNPVEKTFRARMGGFGAYILGADTTAPVVEVIFPKEGQTIKNLKNIRFSATDSLSGIGSDRNLEIYLDGQFVLPEWDPERDRITGTPEKKAVAGNHLIRIRVTDSAGNVTERSIHFSIRKQ